MPPRFIVSPPSILAPFLLIVVHAATATAADDAWSDALRAANGHDYKLAVARASEAIARDPTVPAYYYRRGRWHFRIGDMKASLADFDRLVELQPGAKARLWERGITCYYTGDYKAGSKQFEAYQTYYSNDVENAVWRYLCQAKFDGHAKALDAMLPIQQDARIPMMQIYDLFRGNGSTEQVLAVLPKQESGRARDAHFHGNLYLGLYHDARGNSALAKRHIELATRAYKEGGHYMWAVAVQHQKHLHQKSAVEQTPIEPSR